jgi:hypothetical protein
MAPALASEFLRGMGQYRDEDVHPNVPLKVNKASSQSGTCARGASISSARFGVFTKRAAAMASRNGSDRELRPRLDCEPRQLP